MKSTFLILADAETTMPEIRHVWLDKDTTVLAAVDTPTEATETRASLALYTATGGDPNPGELRVRALARQLAYTTAMRDADPATPWNRVQEDAHRNEDVILLGLGRSPQNPTATHVSAPRLENPQQTKLWLIVKLHGISNKLAVRLDPDAEIIGIMTDETSADRALEHEQKLMRIYNDFLGFRNHGRESNI